MALDNIVNIDFSDALSERYLSYALSTITSRSLPDVRDGLKPVHRRLLFAMLQLKLDPKSGFKKCARVVGDVIGKYHPHGDTAVYDTMVRLAQDFAVRYPLIEGQGNFGSIDGDNAAAMRYTEAKLTEVAMAILEDIDFDTVDFQPTYDNSEIEPTVMPGNFPNLLANGSEGIAVGMATGIPPHNAEELCEALLHIIKHPNADCKDLMQFIKGPDFPTGAILQESPESMLKTYSTGKGSFKIRAKWEKEELSHGMYQIVITEIPYQVQKSRLIEKIADLYKNKKLSLLGNIRDESTEKIRVILDPKNRSVDPELLMESLFKTTELESRYNLNMNVLDKNLIPKVMNIKQVLVEFIEHRIEILVRKSKFRLGKINNRLEILDGLLIAYLNIDEVIKIIREEDDAKQIMIAKWQLTDNQAEAILNIRLRSLRKLEEVEIKREYNELQKEKENLNRILNEENYRKKHIYRQIEAIKEKFGKHTELGKRRTFISTEITSKVISIEAFIEKEPITIICSKKGWIRALKGHIDDFSTVKYKEGDKENITLKAYTTDKLLVFTDEGKFYNVACNNITGGKGHGEPLSLLVDMEQNSAIVSLNIYKKDEYLLIAADNAKGFIVSHNDVAAQTKSGKQILNLPNNVKATFCINCQGDHVAIIGNNRQLLIFDKKEIPVMKRGAGVSLQKYKYGTQSSIADIKCFNLEDGLSWNLGSKVRVEKNLDRWIGKRNNYGKLPPIGFPRSNKFE